MPAQKESVGVTGAERSVCQVQLLLGMVVSRGLNDSDAVVVVWEGGMWIASWLGEDIFL